MKKTGSTGKALLTNHKPEPCIRCCPSESSLLAPLLIMYCFSSLLVSGWLLILYVGHSNAY
uniref:Uncharacterized protein n=1 Tax=Mesocestoides corti TaxID=53468 RepID=A0A5K3EJ22_MESCO